MNIPQDNARSVIEALLFASEKPLTLEQIKKVLDGMDTTQIRAILEELGRDYEQSGRGIRLAEIAGGFQIATFAGYSSFLKKLFKERNAQSLSRPALETLAIIAYKQPLTKLEVELLRNVNVDGVIKSLLEKNLIRISGRKKVAGRPFVYGTTRQFMEYFGLKSLEELPKMEEFGALAKKNDIEVEEIKEEVKEEIIEEVKEEVKEEAAKYEPEPAA